MIMQILRGLKRILFGETHKFNIRKGSASLNGQSWTEIYHEMTKVPLKLISISFITENTIPGNYRIIVNGEKVFPFGNNSNIENGITRNFLLPINVADGSFLQVEVKSGISNKNVIIMDELCVIEVI